jgi:hypothetical protein
VSNRFGCPPKATNQCKKPSTPTSWTGTGNTRLRSGPRSLEGIESGPEFTPTPIITVINTSRLRGRHRRAHGYSCCPAGSGFVRRHVRTRPHRLSPQRLRTKHCPPLKLASSIALAGFNAPRLAGMPSMITRWCSTAGNSPERFAVSRVDPQEKHHEEVSNQPLSP